MIAALDNLSQKQNSQPRLRKRVETHSSDENISHKDYQVNTDRSFVQKRKSETKVSHFNQKHRKKVTKKVTGMSDGISQKSVNEDLIEANYIEVEQKELVVDDGDADEP